MSHHRPLPSPTDRRRGFTLLELMVVVMIVGAMILIIPMNLAAFGARSRLDLGANSVVAALAGTRGQAVQDGYEASLELGWVKQGRVDRAAMRLKFTNMPSQKKLRPGEDEAYNSVNRSSEREWVYTEWKLLPSGVIWKGVSVAKGQWKKLSPGGKGYAIRFYASGDIEQAIAIRLEGTDLENVSEENRIATIIVNGLTSEPDWETGRRELRESLDDSSFTY